MRKTGRYITVVIAITIVLLANTVNASFIPTLLGKIQSTPELSAGKASTLQPTQSKSSSNSLSKEMKNQKSESSFLDFWESGAFARDKRFNEAMEQTDFTSADEDSMELVIGINSTHPSTYSTLVDIVSKVKGKIVNTVSIKEEVIAIVVDVALSDISSFVKDVQMSSVAQYIEPNNKFQVQFVPNDPYWSLQWGPQKIEADWAWNTTVGDPSILVAVIDTGIDYTHPDLSGNYVPLGHDWVNDDEYPLDDNGHGTHCAGIIAAISNNSQGIAGLAQVQIMAEKALDAGGWGDEDDLANAIIDAVDQGADILSNSWGGYEDSMLIHQAVRYAYSNGVLVVAAAGNEGSNTKIYPGAYSEVIGVTATDQYDIPAWFTSFGEWVEVAAPGVDIYSTMPTYYVTLNDPPYNLAQNYDYLSGTSMACPHVAGVAAIIKSHFSNATADWVKAQLRYTADDLGNPGFDEYYGYGRINARKAVEQAPPEHDLLVFEWDKPLTVRPKTSVTFNTTVLNYGKSNESDMTVQLLVNDALIDSASVSFLEPGASATVTTSWNPLSDGMYNVTTYIVPVLDETNTANNIVSAMISAMYVQAALISDSSQLLAITPILDLMGIGYDTYNDNSMHLYTEDLNLLLNYTTVIFYNYDRTITFVEHSTLESYLAAGGNLLVTGYDSLGHPDDPLLADIVHSSSTGDNTGEPDLYVRNPTHPIMNGPFGSFPNGYHIGSLYTDNDAAEADIARGAVTVAELNDYYDKIIATDTAGGKVVYWNGDGSSDWTMNADCEIMFKNTLVWLMPSYEHELLVILEAPDFLVPANSALLNATVCNIGLNNETDVELQLLIDSTLVNSVTISELLTGASYTIDYLWTPLVEGTYNVTAYARPVVGENMTMNNRATKFVKVTYPLINPIPGQYANYIMYYYDPSGYLLGTGCWNITYDYYVEPYKIQVTVWMKDLSGYISMGSMIVNTLNRFVESGVWAGLWYPGWIETDIHIGSAVNLLGGPAIVNSSEMVLIGPRAIDCWEIPCWYGYPYIFWYDKPTGLWISMDTIDPYTGTLIRLLLDDTNVLIGTRYEHDLGVTLDTPQRLEPGDSSLLNATVYNIGLNNETNVQLKLLINNTEVRNQTISNLVNGTSYTINYLWAPSTEGIYNITACALPVFGENVTVNNVVTRLVDVRQAVMIGIIQTHGEYLHSTDLMNYYRGLGYIVDIITTTITPSLLENYDVIIVGEDWYNTPWLSSEIEAVQAYISSGKCFVGIGDELASSVQQILASYGISYTWVYGTPGSTSNFDHYHPIMQGVSSLYASGPVNSLQIVAPAYYIANDAYNTHMLIAGAEVGGYILCLSDDFAADTYADDNEIMFKNIIEWITTTYEHELVVRLEAPSFLQPRDSSLLNATVENKGLNNETNVGLQLLINNTAVENITISQLLSGESYTISHLWIPATTGKYNVTVYAPPVQSENMTRNNIYSKIILVQYAPRILAYVQYADYYQEYPNTLRAIESTFGPNYILTEMGDYTQLDSMIQGKDILLIPEQEYASLSTMQMIGSAWSETLSNFLENGGVIIVCDFFGGSGGTYGILTGAGLMSISWTNYRTSYTLYLVDPTDPLAEGISSSFTAPDGTISFVTGEANVVVADSIYPVVIHKEIDRGHVVLLGFDFYSFNADTEQILGNAVALAAYITISTSPSAGCPGTKVTVSGIKVTANGTVSIYWDDILMGNTTANNMGDFAYLLTVPENATVGVHKITAVDTATGRTASTSFKVLLIAMNPTKGPIGTKVTVKGAGFQPESQATVTFNDMLIGYAKVDSFGNFTFIFNIPLSSAEAQTIKALDAEANYASATFTVVDLTPLNVQVDVGTIHFRGELAEFYSQIVLKGIAVNATNVSAVLYGPNGGVVNYNYPENITLTTTGLYKILYNIPVNVSTGTYTLVITASYVTDTVQASGASFTCFLISPTLTSMNAYVVEIRENIATVVIPDLGTVKLNLTAIKAMILKINGTTVDIKTALGVIKDVNLADIQLKVTAINGTTATIKSILGTMNGTITGTISGDIATIVIPGVGEIQADISSLKGTQETWIIPQYAIIIIALIAAVSSTLSLIFLRRRKTTEAK
jgi:thermitase